MTRSVIALLLVLAIACAASANLDGCLVMMTSPTEVLPGGTYTFSFWVQNESQDGEGIATIQISFPDGYTIFEGTMACDEIVVGRPSFDMYIPPIDHTAIWEDNNGGTGEILPTEGTTVYIDATVADVSYGTPIFWCVQGDGTGDEVHEVCGCIQVAINPVEELSWTSIKALYR